MRSKDMFDMFTRWQAQCTNRKHLERERHTHRQTLDSERDNKRERDRQGDSERDNKTERDRQGDSERDNKTERGTDRETQKETIRQRGTDRETQKETIRQREEQTGRLRKRQ